jgi:hypothetical protein
MSEFNADEFCKEMQDKAKSLTKRAEKQTLKGRVQQGQITLILNGKKYIHNLPCTDVPCSVCEKINEIQSKVDDMMNQMNDAFGDMFGSWF